MKNHLRWVHSSRLVYILQSRSPTQLCHMANAYSCPRKAGGKFPILSSWKRKTWKLATPPPQRKSLKTSDAQYLAMINRPGCGPRGVRRCVLEPSSNRLAEQCDVAHLARTPVRSPRRASLPDLIPHCFNIHHTQKKKMCTRKPNPPPAVAQTYLLVMSTTDCGMNSKYIFIFHDKKMYSVP